MQSQVLACSRREQDLQADTACNQRCDHEWNNLHHRARVIIYKYAKLTGK